MISTRALKVVLLTITTILFILTVLVSYLSTSPAGRAIGLFREANESWSQRQVYNRTNFQPPGWAFSVWGLIYAYQLALLIYCWSTIFRSSPTGHLCVEPDLIPALFLFFYTMTNVGNSAWVIFTDRADLNTLYVIPQCVIIYLASIFSYIALASSCHSTFKAKHLLALYKMQKDYYLVVFLVHNALAMYATWLTVASSLNLHTAVIYNTDLPADVMSIICLSYLMGVIIVYVILDLTILDRVLRYIFTPHLILLFAFGSAISNNFTPWTANFVLLVILVILAGLALLLKFVAICLRRKDKLVTVDAYPLTDSEKI